MVNAALFQTQRGKAVPHADAVNHAGGKAYTREPKQALAQIAATGCFGGTYYANAEAQLTDVAKLTEALEPEYLAKVALFARERGYMKDMPAFLVATLAKKKPALCEAVFPRVIDNFKMLQNFVQIVRSNAIGRKSFGTSPKRAVLKWLESRTEEQLFRNSIGAKPSFADIVKMVHPKPTTDARRAFYGYMLGKEHDASFLPPVIRQFEAFKKGETAEVPRVDFRMLTALELTQTQWEHIARNANWTSTRMNLNTFARHGVFKSEDATLLIADKLKEPDLVRKARVFPYQLMMAYSAAGGDVPLSVKEALQDAMEVALENVPTIDGEVFVCVDTSGSMRSPVTGYRGTATSAVSCVAVASLIAAALVRKNTIKAHVIPFDTQTHAHNLNPRDTVLTNARRLAEYGGGGTDCSVAMREIRGAMRGKILKAPLVVYVSDNESWWGQQRWYGRVGTGLEQEWKQFQSEHPHAKLVCIDLTPNTTTQAKEDPAILNVGGFSDHVFEILSLFHKGELNSDHWVGEIEKIAL